MAGGARPGAGRKAGIPNKLTTDVKKMVLAALDKAGGEQYLYEQAINNPNAFMTILGKIIPTQVNHADNEGGKLTLADILGVIDGTSAGLPEPEEQTIQ